jgi:hypothetical protein
MPRPSCSCCEPCGLTYDAMRTGLTFAAVKQMMYSGPDPSTWRSKSRRAVLGFWHQIKIGYWEMHLGQCATEPANDNAVRP